MDMAVSAARFALISKESELIRMESARCELGAFGKLC